MNGNTKDNRIKADPLRGGWRVVHKGRTVKGVPFKESGEAFQFLQDLLAGRVKYVEYEE